MSEEKKYVHQGSMIRYACTCSHVHVVIVVYMQYGISLIAGHLFSKDISQCNSVPNREKVSVMLTTIHVCT